MSCWCVAQVFTRSTYVFLLVVSELLATQGLLIEPSSNPQGHPSDNLWHGAAQLRCPVTQTPTAAQ